MRLRAPATSALLALAIQCAAVGDSDGYYCATANYLAFQVSFSAGPHRQSTPLAGVSAGHELHIAAVDKAGGVFFADPVSLPYFVPKSLECDSSSLQLWSFDTVYTVDLTDVRAPKFVGSRDRESQDQPVGESRNLGAWFPVSYPLPTDNTHWQELPLTAPGVKYWLRVRLDPSDSPCESRVDTDLVIQHDGQPRQGHIHLLSASRHSDCAGAR